MEAPQYAAGKYGVMGLTKSYANAFAPTVRVNAFAPGFMETEATLAREDWNSGRREKLIAGTPAGRIPPPQEMAAAALFLATDDAAHMIGSYVIAEGGYNMIGACADCSAMTTIGRPIPRFEDPMLLTGAATYVADIQLEGCLDAFFVRSWAAHGTLRDVDLSTAREHPRVAGAFAAADLPDLPRTPARPIPDIPPEMKRPALPPTGVRFTGEAVAIVVAEDRASAEDAAETVLVDVGPLPLVLDPTAAADPNAMQLFDGIGNVALDRTIGQPVADDIAAAPVVIEVKVRHARVAPVSIEPRAFLVRPEEHGGITVWCSHQAPHRLRNALVQAFGLDVERVRVIVPSVGGAFGGKSQIYPEYIVATHVARMLGRPVRWIEDRRESFLSASSGRGQNQRVRLAADATGRLLAAEVELDGDAGAYPHIGALVPTFTTTVLSGPYRIPKMSVRVRSIVTNAPPTAAYRGAGRPEAAMLLERAMDELARRVGLDPLEIRLRNFIEPQEFPYASPTGAVYDSGSYAEAMQEALRLADYRTIREEQRRRRELEDRDRLLGIGVASFVERTGGQNGTTEFGRVDVMADGFVEARSGSSSIGQGHATAFAQVVASVFDVEPSRICVIQGDTAEVAAGSFASRSVQVGGEALHTAAKRVVAESRRRAASLIEVAEEDLRYAQGVFQVAGTPTKAVTLASIVERTGPLGDEEVAEATQAFPFGTYIAVVEVDGESGEIEVRKLVAVDDCGVIVNPMLVHGQTIGSAVQGLGQVLFEQMAFDENGRLQHRWPTTWSRQRSRFQRS